MYIYKRSQEENYFHGFHVSSTAQTLEIGPSSAPQTFPEMVILDRQLFCSIKVRFTSFSLFNENKGTTLTQKTW